MAWLTGWNRRRSHSLISATGAGTDYQIKIVVNYGAGSTSGDDIYCNSHCETDFGDIRFTDDDGSTELDYWMQEYTDSDNAIFWVKVTDSLSSNQSIYVYYDKSGESTTSDGEATGEFFDDFSNTIASDVRQVAVQRNEDAYVYKDFGVDNFDALDITFKAKIISGNASVNAVLALGSIVDDALNLGAGSLNVILHHAGGAVYKIWLDRDGQTGNDDYQIVLGKDYYCHVERAAGNDTVTMKIYDEAARTTLLDTLSVAGFGATKWRYLYAASSWNSGAADAGTVRSGNISIDSGSEEDLSGYTEVDPNGRITINHTLSSEKWTEEFVDITIDQANDRAKFEGAKAATHGGVYSNERFASGVILWKANDSQSTGTNSINIGGIYPKVETAGRDIYYWATLNQTYTESRFRINDVTLYSEREMPISPIGLIDTFFTPGYAKLDQDGVTKDEQTDVALTIANGLSAWIATYNSHDGFVEAEWVFLRKFVNPEPTHGAWGSEERFGDGDTAFTGFKQNNFRGFY